MVIHKKRNNKIVAIVAVFLLKTKIKKMMKIWMVLTILMKKRKGKKIVAGHERKTKKLKTIKILMIFLMKTKGNKLKKLINKWMS
jgi:hypothetical protein